jgi:G:T-mismatch repair DNA endonuclease (very short patch repair protein)
MARNKVRDRLAVELAQSLGYHPLRFWECDVCADPGREARTIASLAKQESLRRTRG